MFSVLSILIHIGIKFTMALVFLLKFWVTWTIICRAAADVIYFMLWSPKIMIWPWVHNFIVDRLAARG
jgi:hypothetical protein